MTGEASLPVYARRAALVGIAALWLVSLMLPAVRVSDSTLLDGADILRRGWQATRADVFAWYANPVFLLALACAGAGRARAAGVLAGVAVLLALTSLAVEELARDSGMGIAPVSFEVGFYVWIATLLALLAWSWARVAAERVRGDAGGGRRGKRDNGRESGIDR